MKPFRITTLEAHQIGPFGDLKMVFPEKPIGMEGKAEVHILTGENGTGKSTVLEVMIYSILFDADRGFDFSNIILSKCRKKNKTISALSVDYSEGNPFAVKIVEDREDLVSENNFLEDYFSLFKRTNHSHSFAAFAYSGYRFIESVALKGIEEVDHMPLSSALLVRSNTNPKEILQWIANNLAKEALANSAANSVSAAKYRKAISDLEKSISTIIDREIRFALEFEPFKILIEVNHERLDFNLLPDGLKSIISWLADLLMRMDRVKWVDDIPVFERNFILFLDEIEVHMHPRWQRKILPAVQGLFPNAQIFISTHSPFVINSVDGAWIHRLVKPNGDSVALEPVLSEDGKSISMVLDEIFGVTEQFGEAVEQDLKTFYDLRNKVLKDAKASDGEQLQHIAKKLKGQSTTLDQIVEMELRQVNRLKQLQLTT